MHRILATAAFALAATVASAQSWPTKSVTVIVPWPAGGPSDIAARPVAKALSEQLKHPFPIDNRGGASGNIGTAVVAKQQPADGYTILITSGAPIAINPSLFRTMLYDAAKDIQPVTNVLRVPLVLAVHPSVPARTVKEVVAWLAANKDKAQYASAGSGTPQHLTAELFKSVAKADVTHVPYKGSAPMITDVIGGHVPVVFDSTIAIVPHLKSGKLVPIATTGAKRSPQLPDVPTFAEAGLAGVESYAWYGLFVRAGTPKDIVAKLNAEALRAMKTPEFARVLADTGSEFVGDTPENFAKFVDAERAKWGALVKRIGATVD